MSVVVGYVPTDTGYLALTEAVREARSLQGPLVVVNVIGDLGYVPPTAADERDLDAVGRRLAEWGVDHDIRQIQASGDVAAHLLRVAGEVSAKLIVVGLHRMSPVGKVLLGSTAQGVILGAPCPVLSVRHVEA